MKIENIIAVLTVISSIFIVYPVLFVRFVSIALYANNEIASDIYISNLFTINDYISRGPFVFFYLNVNLVIMLVAPVALLIAIRWITNEIYGDQNQKRKYSKNKVNVLFSLLVYVVFLIFIIWLIKHDTIKFIIFAIVVPILLLSCAYLLKLITNAGKFTLHEHNVIIQFCVIVIFSVICNAIFAEEYVKSVTKKEAYNTNIDLGSNNSTIIRNVSIIFILDKGILYLDNDNSLNFVSWSNVQAIINEKP